MRTRFSVATVLLGILAGHALAQTPDNDKLIKYYRKKNNVPPAQAVTVTDVKDSPIKGAKQQKVDAFWKMYHGFFANQKDVNPTNVKDKAWEFVSDQGLDKAKFDDCFDNKKTQAGVKADIAEGQSVGVTGTPSFVINGRLLVGAQPYEQFKAVIDDELASSK